LGIPSSGFGRRKLCSGSAADKETGVEEVKGRSTTGDGVDGGAGKEEGRASVTASAGKKPLNTKRIDKLKKQLAAQARCKEVLEEVLQKFVLQK